MSVRSFVLVWFMGWIVSGCVEMFVMYVGCWIVILLMVVVSVDLGILD